MSLVPSHRCRWWASAGITLDHSGATAAESHRLPYSPRIGHLTGRCTLFCEAHHNASSRVCQHSPACSSKSRRQEFRPVMRCPYHLHRLGLFSGQSRGTVVLDPQLRTATAWPTGEPGKASDMMITPAACPRCRGAILDYQFELADSPLCIVCGWRRPDVSPEIRAEVETHLGRALIGNQRKRRIGSGKPPPSGWEREKRRREREKLRLAQENRRLETRSRFVGVRKLEDGVSVSVDPDTGHPMVCADLSQLRHLQPAIVNRDGATSVEHTPLGRIHRAWHVSRENNSLPLGLNNRVRNGDGREQGLSVGVEGIFI